MVSFCSTILRWLPFSFTKIRRLHHAPSDPVGHGPDTSSYCSHQTHSQQPDWPPCYSPCFSSATAKPTSTHLGAFASAFPLLGILSLQILPGSLCHFLQITLPDTCSSHTFSNSRHLHTPGPTSRNPPNDSLSFTALHHT